MKDDLIQQLNVARQKLLDVLSRYPDEGTIVNDWSKEQLLAHIVGWEEEGIASIPKILRGEKPDAFKMSVDRFNKISVEKYHGLGVAELLIRLVKLRRQLIEEIKRLDEGQVTAYYGTMLGKKPINVLWVIHEAISHDENHAKELELSLGEEI